MTKNQKKMGKATFEELIDLKKWSAEKEIHHIHEEILALNDKIIKLEDQLDPNFRKNIVSKIKVKKDELSAHESLKPIAVEDPSKQAETEDTKAKKKELESLESSKLEIEEDIDVITKKVSDRNYLIVEAEKLNRDLKNKYIEVLSVISEGKDIAEKCGFDISNVIRVEFDENVIGSNVLNLREKNRDDANLIKVGSSSLHVDLA